MGKKIIKIKAVKKAKKPLKLQDAIRMFLDAKEFENLSDKTVKYYDQNLKRFMTCLKEEFELEEPTCEDFTAHLIVEYGKVLKARDKWDGHPDIVRQRKRDKISRNTYRTYINAVRVFGNWLNTKGYIEEDILNGIKLPKKEDKIIRILSTDEIKTIFKEFNTKTELGLRNYLIVRLALDLGLRESSIVSLRVSGISLDKKEIQVLLKGGKWDYYAIDQTLRNRLREYINLYRSSREVESEEDKDMLFLNINGKAITTNTIRQIFKRLKAKTGIKELGCHLLRHNFAANFISKQGKSLEELKGMLGHTTTRMSERYGNVAKMEKRVSKGHDSYLNSINVK